ncbi:hypothetical protein CN692_07305 [Bacillus sp. AFS002410]|uniref:hypothetical protein n=1 Tax=Bacillus sp. AFS002410 TaxID=2033481 RepID=UPI000BF13CA0|nr:hypothetical protein [Bacillus sp. AFS002410]PEJ59277.1 hypothetical protein CN692_07305 [Bacillus sp. AFS002410]
MGKLYDYYKEKLLRLFGATPKNIGWTSYATLTIEPEYPVDLENLSFKNIDWLELYENLEVVGDYDEVSTDFRIREFISSKNHEPHFSLITEFYLMLGNQFENGEISIFVNNKLDKKLISEVILHFNNCRVVYENDLPTEVILSNPKKVSLNEVHKQGINPIISDLYGNVSESEPEWSPSLSYKVVPEKIEKYEDQNFDLLFEYLISAKKDKHFLSFSWLSLVLDETLIESVAIRYFAHKCKNMYLWVNREKKITMIQLEI